MNTKRIFSKLSATALAACLAGLTGCGVPVTRVKPGQSARQMLADRNAPPPLVPVIPGAMPTPAGNNALGPANGMAAGPLIPPPLPDITADPSMPDASDVANRVADFYTRGSFAMQAGQNTEAIAALEEAVKLDPNFTDAWTKLVKIYERTGNNAKAAEAYKTLKRLGVPNGAPVSNDSSPGLGLIR